jgi:uncharacterized lipoprotein YajG
MKMTILLIIALVPLLLTGCNKPQTSHVVTPAETAKIQSVALASIIAKYPDINSSELVFYSMTNVMTSGAGEVIEVRYILPASAETSQQNTQSSVRTTTKMRGFQATMSKSSKVQSVSEGIISTVNTVIH